MASFSPPRRTGFAPQVDAQGNQVSEVLPNEFKTLGLTRQQLEQQLVAAHRTQNVQAAQQAAYAIRAYDQNILSAQVPSINAPPPIDRVPKPTFGSYLENLGIGYGEELGKQVRDIGGMVERGVTAFSQDPLKASAAAFMSVLEPARQGFTQPVQTAKDVGAGVVETGRQMATQAQSGPIGLGGVMGQLGGLPGPDMPGRRKPTMAELDVYHGTPHTFDPEEGAPLGRFRSEKIGTGEGNQSYGYGLYFSESPTVAKSYQSSVSAIHKSGTPTIEGKPVNWDDAKQVAAYELSRHNGDRTAAANFHARMFLGGEDNPAVKLLRSSEQLPTVDLPGKLYKVDLPDAKIEQMLDWDTPLSEQPQSVRTALTKLAKSDEQLFDKLKALGPNATGDMAYSVLTEYAVRQKKYDQMRNGIPEKDATPSLTYGQSQASDLMRSFGIPGIKYLDQGSRDGGKGTRNFVVFPGEEQNLTVLERNGERAVAKTSATNMVENSGPYSPGDMPKIIRDNPGGDWLTQKRKYAEAQGTKPSGAFKYPGELTARYNDTVYLPVSVLEKIPGENMEQFNVRRDSLDWLTEEMSKTNRLPTFEAGGKQYDNAPFITVDSRGRPFVTEGNHRIMVAKQLGWQYLPVEIRYFNGGELEDGPFNPKQLEKFTKQAKP